MWDQVIPPLSSARAKDASSKKEAILVALSSDMH